MPFQSGFEALRVASGSGVCCRLAARFPSPQFSAGNPRPCALPGAPSAWGQSLGFFHRPPITEESTQELRRAIRHLGSVKAQPAVRQLAALAGFEPVLQAWELRFPGLMPVVQPLVMAGLDRDDNLDLLFGEYVGAVRPVQREARMYVLAAPPEGSPAYAMGLRGPQPSSPDQPAAPAVVAALPRWQRQLARVGRWGTAPCATST